MTTTRLLGGLAALALVAAGGVAAARQATDSTAAPATRGDADGDGRLSQAEFTALRLNRLRAADANGDGSVSVEERQASRHARRASRADARFDRLDADKDGAISRAEFDAVRAARRDRGRRAMPGRQDRRGPRDAPVAIADMEARAAQAFARLDADRDGYVTADERRAARHAIRAHRRGQMASPPAPASE